MFLLCCAYPHYTNAIFSVMSYIFVRLRCRHWSLRNNQCQLLSPGFGIPSPLLLWYCFLKNCSIGTSCSGRVGGNPLSFTVLSSGPCSKVDFCNVLMPGIHDNAFIISNLLLRSSGSIFLIALNHMPTFLCQAFFLLWRSTERGLVQFVFVITLSKLVPVGIFSNKILVLVRIILAVL